MISTKPLVNSQHAGHYFMGKDNYYTQDNQDLAQERSSWWGKGAQALNLQGTIDKQVFSQLLDGRLPQGEQLGLMRDGSIKHRVGTDITFSVPKSVSIAALLGGDERILPAIHKATDVTLGLMERECAQARMTRTGETTYENTRNLVVAKFLHDISREADPQLHVHAVVLNMTQRSDGKWRSLASQSGRYDASVKGEINGFLERVRRHKLHYGSVFRSELAYELKQLGYDIRQTDKNNFFEIAGIGDKTIAAYSQRSQQIRKAMQEKGVESANAAAAATLATRQAKKHINRDSLTQLWQVRADLNHIDAFGEARQVVEHARRLDKNQSLEIKESEHLSTAPQNLKPEIVLTNKTISEKITTESLLPEAIKAVDFAIAHLSETDALLRESDILRQALRYTELVTLRQVSSVIEHYQTKGQLITVKETDGMGIFTTPAIIAGEKFILQAATETMPQAILPNSKANKCLQTHTTLNREQKAALNHVLTAEKRLTLIEGASQTGKTHLLKPLMEAVKYGGYQPVILTASRLQQAEREQQLQPHTLKEWFKQLFNQQQYATVMQFLHRASVPQAKPLFARSQVLLIDDAHQLSTTTLAALLKVAQEKNQRVILLGDNQAMPNIGQGAPFKQLLQANPAIVKLQKQYAPHLGAVMADSLAANIDAAFAKIGQRIMAIPEKEERLTGMARHYAHMPIAQTLILMPSQLHCQEMNSAVRDAMKNTGQLLAQGKIVEVWLPKRLSSAESVIAKSYREGQVLRFNENYRGIKRGEYATIAAVHHTISVKTASGKTISWIPGEGKTELFDKAQRELAPGDWILWRRSQSAHKRYAGERMEIVDIKNNTLTCRHLNGKTFTVDLQQGVNRHFDYGYALTPWQNVAKTDHILAYQSSAARQTHQRQFYATLAQAKEQVWIYTESTEQLAQRLLSATGDKATAIGALVQDNTANPLALLEQAVLSAIAQAKANKDLANTITHKDKTPEETAQEAVRYALAHLSEREAAFLHKDVLETALNYALGDVNQKIIQAAVKAAEDKGQLIRGLASQDGTRWTTPEMLALEKEIITLARQDVGKLAPVCEAKLLQSHLDTLSLKAEHRTALERIGTHTDRLLLIEGYAGTGKTTLLKHLQPLLSLNHILKDQQHELLCLAPTHVAVNELKQRGLQAQTLESFLLENKNTATNWQDKRILAVDEASMISNRRFRDLCQLANTAKARLLIIGDERQYSAIEAGKPVALLKSLGTPVVYLQDIERQHNPVLKEAVQATYQQQFKQAFAQLDSRIKEIPDQEERLTAIAHAYVEKSASERAQSLIVTFGNDDRKAQNSLIRDALKARGELQGASITATILVNQGLTQTEKTHIRNYQVGDQLRFGQAQPKLLINKGEYLTITNKEERQQALWLSNAQGEKVLWRIPQKNPPIEVYRQEEREMQRGDLIRWTRSDKESGLLSPDLAKVIQVEDKQITLAKVKFTPQGMETGKTFTVQPQQPRYQHWDYAWAMTGYSAQSKSISHVLVNAESYRRNLASQPSFLVAISRAVNELTLYTDNKAALLHAIERNPGGKNSALEVTGQAQNWLNPSVEKTTPFSAVQTEISSSAVSASTQKIATTPAKTPETILQKSHQPRRVKTSTQPKLDARQITQALHDNAEGVLERLLGKPKAQEGKTWRYGSHHGSLVVTLQGDKRGLWQDFQTGAGGNLLTLVAQQYGLNIKDKAAFPAILQKAGEVLGKDFTVAMPQEKSALPTTALPAQKEKISDTLQYARKLAQQSLPLAGTLAEKYLQTHRGISLTHLPDSVRFHPGICSGINKIIKPALLVIAKDEKQQVQAVQAIYLDEKTAAKAEVKVKKQTWGNLKTGATAAVHLPQVQSNKVYLAEGVETGLSILTAIPEAQVFITLGKSNFKNVTLPETVKTAVLCVDNDGQSVAEDKLIQAAAKNLADQNKHVWIAQPEQAKSDYNDVLKQQGKVAIQQNLAQAQAYNRPVSPISPADASQQWQSSPEKLQAIMQGFDLEQARKLLHNTPQPDSQRWQQLVEKYADNKGIPANLQKAIVQYLRQQTQSEKPLTQPEHPVKPLEKEQEWER